MISKRGKSVTLALCGSLLLGCGDDGDSTQRAARPACPVTAIRVTATATVTAMAPAVMDRVGFFMRYAQLLSTDVGDNLYCDMMGSH